MAKKLNYDDFFCVYRNTWKNNHGHIRTQVYESVQQAEYAAKNCKTHMFQEVGTPVYTSQCLIPGG